MRSSYSPLDWVLFHWAHLTVRRLFMFIDVYFVCFLFSTAYVLFYCEHGGVDLMGLKRNPLTLLVGLFDL